VKRVKYRGEQKGGLQLMKSLRKLFLLIEVALRNPLEFFDRFEAFLTIRWEKGLVKRASYPIISAAEAIAQIIKLGDCLKSST
jgi:hypothetical protein